MKQIILSLLIAVICVSCSKTQPETGDSTLDSTMYFPPVSGTEWQTISPGQLGWKSSALSDLNDFLRQTNSRSFMILVNGRIVVENYYNGHHVNQTWPWNSAGKTLVSALTGIAQQEHLLNTHDKADAYLGSGWTNMPQEKENLITLRHLLTMTSGIDDSKQWVIKTNLTYTADAGARWAYGNVFQKLIDVVATATDKDFETYFSEKLKTSIGMTGAWNFGSIFNIYHSNSRSMARFGLLALNKGTWNNRQIINETYFSESISPSQNLNPSYGYFWWLNGQAKFMLPNEQNVYAGPLIPNAPADMYAAMGAGDQRIYVVPGRKMVIVRMGNASNPDDPEFAVSGFDNQLWEKINAVID